VAWGQLLAGRTVLEAVDALTSHFATDRATLAADLERFARELVAEDLVAETDVAEPRGVATLSATGSPYEPPVLEKYTDMQELLALDPVHDVEVARGWPAVAEKAV
jgi:Coenzyme PQQ synthesis protein D (PqqD)